jgi:hypothetical protein
MYIGEISKPTVDRTEIKKKFDVKPAEALEPTRVVSDTLDLSQRSKRQMKKQLAADDGERELEENAAPRSKESGRVTNQDPAEPVEGAIHHIDLNA